MGTRRLLLYECFGVFELVYLERGREEGYFFMGFWVWLE